MVVDRRGRISDLYHAALARAPEERSAFVKDAANGDDSLRQEVESLLAYEPASSRLLERPAVDVVARCPPSLVGRQLGPYQILSPLGAGGMGDVYRARDAKLDRDVAIKMLPPHFMADPERRARFAREARLLATLNHPHIGAIYGLEETDGVTALILELVEGPTLAERLEPGPLPVADALAIARQVAEALEAAHDKGIVHRDLKPANIVLQGASGSAGDARAKVLDFGLAKTLAVGPTHVRTHMAPGSVGATGEGLILGTPAYMSPEQARGLAVDKRTDIWAFGCVLYEMLSGRRAFDGETITDTLAHILERDPDWSVLPADTPAAIRLLLERCLRKDPRKRLHDIADAIIEIDECHLDGVSSRASGHLMAPDMRPYRRHRRLAWSVASSLLALGLLTIAWFSLSPRAASPAAPYVEFSVGPPENARFQNAVDLRFAVAPDGGHLAFTARDQNQTALWVRLLGTADGSRMIAGTQGAMLPFWSPDSRQIGFFAGSKLKKVDVSGGTPVDVCDLRLVLPTSRLVGATWNHSDVIVFGTGAGPLRRVSAAGGAAVTVTTLENGDIEHRWPLFLPDGDHFLYLAHRADGHDEMRVGSIDSTRTTSLGRFEGPAAYASGHLLFQQGGQLVARRFDVSSLQMHGDPFVVVEPASLAQGARPRNFSVSDTGVVAYLGPFLNEGHLTWLDRNGRPLRTVGDGGIFSNLDLSPDEKRVAVSLTSNNNVDIWLVDLDRDGDRVRLTTDPAQEFDPAWSPDGEWVAFHSNRTGTRSLFRRASDGSGQDELLFKAETGSVGGPDWSDSGLLFHYNHDLFVQPLTDGRKPFPFRSTPFSELQGAFSPDGHSVAFASDQSGRYEIYVSAFPGGTDRKVSRDGGRAPRWSRDGKEVFFLSQDSTLMVARIATEPSITSTIPQPLFPTNLYLRNQKPYAVAKDGQRFLMPVPVDPARSPSITVGFRLEGEGAEIVLKPVIPA